MLMSRLRTQTRKCESRAVFCWGRIRNTLCNKYKTYFTQQILNIFTKTNSKYFTQQIVKKSNNKYKIFYTDKPSKPIRFSHVLPRPHCQSFYRFVMYEGTFNSGKISLQTLLLFLEKSLNTTCTVYSRKPFSHLSVSSVRTTSPV